MGRIEAICVSETKGMRKAPVGSVHFLSNHGIQGDAHAGPWHRQVSLLAAEDIERIHRQRLPDLSPGDFAENLIVSGLDLKTCGLGTQLCLGKEVILRLSQIGKVCHTPCRIFYMTGECAMPGLGLFARVEQGGRVSVGDPVKCDCKVDRDLYQAVVMTVSDSQGATEGALGPAVAQVLETRLASHVYRCITVPDERDPIEERLQHYCNGHSIDLVVIVGGPRSSSRDSASEATCKVIDRLTPGLDESMRLASATQASHAVSGICKSTVVLNLSGSQHAVTEHLGAIVDALHHELAKLRSQTSNCGESERDEVVHD